MRNRFKTRKERIMFSVGTILSTTIPFLATNKFITVPFYIVVVLCLTGITLLFSLRIMQKRNGYVCGRKQSADYLDGVNVEKETFSK